MSHHGRPSARILGIPALTKRRSRGSDPTPRHHRPRRGEGIAQESRSVGESHPVVGVGRHGADAVNVVHDGTHPGDLQSPAPAGLRRGVVR